MRSVHWAFRAAASAIIMATVMIYAVHAAGGDGVGPEDAVPKYESEDVAEGGTWVTPNPDDPNRMTWTRTRRTKGGPENACHWEWTKTWNWEKKQVPKQTWWWQSGNVAREHELLMWAYGAFVEGLAYAFDYQNGEVAEVFDAVAGDGTITVRLISAPECDKCVRTISAMANPRVTLLVDRFNSPAEAKVGAVLQVVGTALGNVQSKAEGGIVSDGAAGTAYSIEVGPFKVSLTSSAGNDKKIISDLTSDSKNVDFEAIHFASNAYLKAYANGTVVPMDEGRAQSRLTDSSMNTEITAACSGCCLGWVRIKVETGTEK
ncbi:MAG: hypothetical protein IT464_07660 [Planctomycetes bacterium]|nr:hypothetical protein [Planctomycetota bacterium]